MTASWLILADDLSGAADCAVAFGKRGVEANVVWSEQDARRAVGVPVLSFDADSRALSPAIAAQRHSLLLHQLHRPPARLYKKIDSTLRGQPAAEIAVCTEYIRAQHGRSFGILAPAFPATGRTTHLGRVHLSGQPLEQTELWRRDHSYPSADLLEILRTAAVTGAAVPLAVVRGGGLQELFVALMREHVSVIAVCDAETENDLARIARAACSDDGRTWFIGSAGLAHALAQLHPGDPRAARPSTNATHHGSLLVVGSRAQASHLAASTLAQSGAVESFRLDARSLQPGSGSSAMRDIGTQLERGRDVLVVLDDISAGGDVLDHALVATLAQTLAPLAPHIGALAATGGETASALLGQFGVSGIQLIDEIEPGIALGLTLGAIAVPVVTKAGGFGDERVLMRIADKLRSIRKTGNLA